MHDASQSVAPVLGIYMYIITESMRYNNLVTKGNVQFDEEEIRSIRDGIVQMLVGKFGDGFFSDFLFATKFNGNAEIIRAVFSEPISSSTELYFFVTKSVGDYFEREIGSMVEHIYEDVPSFVYQCVMSATNIGKQFGLFACGTEIDDLFYTDEEFESLFDAIGLE